MSSPRVFEGKLAIITGASRSFGAAVATHFASRGANVVLNYATASSDKLAQDLAKKLSTEHKIIALPVRADLLDPTAPQQLISAAQSHFTHNGTFQIDILINNAAIVNAQPLHALDLTVFQQTFDLNLTSYAGSKGALEAMTRVWACELAEHATVNCVSPGPIDTGLLSGLPHAPRETLRLYNALTPLARERPGVDSQAVLDLASEIGGRPGSLDEVAGIVGVACLPESGWMTGCQLGASGGGAFVR
ncbi:3-oxoacyl-reductase [Lizonia empirigonia]|nr:3-oxoacyl-reductase [Lizonia empirigonia]